jgi:signal transduction histidine kinase
MTGTAVVEGSHRDPRDEASGRSGDRVPRTKPTPASILIVDDVEANLIALEAVLEPLQCKLVRARSGEEALKHLLFEDFALLLIDVVMPRLDGVTTATLIKNRGAARYTPIIFLTAQDGRPQEIAQAYAQGAADYLTKPVDPDILRSKVAVFVELFRNRKELEVQTELAQRREREASENRRLYESERGARAHAEAIARAREDIIAVVSHDLRNPMTSIVASAALIKRTAARGATDGVVSRIETIERSVAQMESIVNDLLDTAKIQAGRLSVQLKVEDLSSMLEQIGEQFRPVLAAKTQILKIVVPGTLPWVKCDRERIFRVFSNLIGNASKFSPPGETITVEASARPGEVVFAIVDQGCGISADHEPHIFEPYWQASQQRQRGLGLGLAIAKGIIDAHGTRIWVQSRVGVGSRFFFTLLSPDGEAAPL